MNAIVETLADKEIKKALEEETSFSVIAGAGAGKTTSLVGSLNYIRDTKGAALLRDKQKVVCITYTKRAVAVISERLGWDDLFRVSTLHSFLWGEVKSFTKNIRETLEDHIIPSEIKKKQDIDKGGTSKRAIAARERVAELQASFEDLKLVSKFRYDDSNYSDYSEGLLGHDDVIRVAAYLLKNNAVLQSVFGQKYPYIFIDEAQDTFPEIVDAMNQLCSADGLPLVGYFGDPMQQIYESGAGDFSGPGGSIKIPKEENYRCSRQVIQLLNNFRNDLSQVPAGDNVDREGSVEIMLMQGETPTEARGRYSDEQISRALARFDDAVESWGWQSNPNLKCLYLVRQMIARRLGFVELHKLFTGQFSSSKSQDDYESGEHYLLEPAITVIWPLLKAYREGDQRRVVDILRRHSPAFDAQGKNKSKSVAEMIELARSVLASLNDLWGSAPMKAIYEFCNSVELCDFSDRLRQDVARDRRVEEYQEGIYAEEKGDWLADEFFDFGSAELESFSEFVEGNQSVSTQHGVKGEEYPDVLVVYDDVEAGWNNFSFTKMLAPHTHGSPTEGQLSRSRKLAYVSFSRAETNLKILLFTQSPADVERELLARGLFRPEQISLKLFAS